MRMSNIIAPITAAILLLTLIFTIINRSKGQKIAEIQFVSDLLKEYMQLIPMYSYLDNFWKTECDGKKENVKGVIEKIKEDRKDSEKLKKLEITRLPVSHFYQKLALMHEENVIRESLIFKEWDENNILLVDVLLIPWEETKEGYSVKAVERLQKLYKDSKKYEDC